jgi:hypothetical protein
MTSHIVLLGDSILDNKAYTGGAPDVVAHLQALLPQGWRASLCAVDGSTTADLAEQIERVPPDASHLVISLGGNDALLNSDLLRAPVSSTARALSLIGARVDAFEAAYRAALEEALRLKKQTTLCTIYNGNLNPEEAPLARIALMTFNDVILRCAFERRLPVIDLRFVCTSPFDYANPIEPSGSGGKKIAQAIARSCGAKDGPAPSQVYAG